MGFGSGGCWCGWVPGSHPGGGFPGRPGGKMRPPCLRGRPIRREFGSTLLGWWDGHGAAKVLAQDGPAVLLERAENQISLSELARTGRDDEATAIICAAVAELHAARTFLTSSRCRDGL